MIYDIVKLKFKSPLHIATGKAGDESSAEILASDALKSALFATAIDGGLGVDNGQDGMLNTCPFLDAFRVSSAFPFWKEEYFFPKPQSAIPEMETNDKNFNQHKEKKEIRYIGKSIFEKILNSDASTHYTHKIKRSECLFGGKYISSATGFKPDDFIMKRELLMRVAVPRGYSESSNEATPYYTERIHFHEDGGLYFFIEMEDEKQRATIKKALEILGDNGIGTDRGTGNGYFEPEWAKIDISIPEKATHRIMLSLYCPERDEISNNADLNSSAYSLIKRGGWVAHAQNSQEHTTYRKRSVYMFAEGSVFPDSTGTKYKGVLHNLKPVVMGKETHPVWRDGRTFSLPINPIWS